MNPDYVDFMNLVNTFYENSWNKLLFIISVIFAVVGVVIPIAIQVYQQKQFKDATKDSIGKVDQALLKMKQDVVAEIELAEKRLEEKLDAKYAERYRKLELGNRRANAYAFHLQGVISQKDGHSGDALASYSASISGYHAVSDHTNLQVIFGNIIKIYDGMDTEEFQEIDESTKKVEKSIEEVEKNDDQKVYAKLLGDVRKAIQRALKRKKS